MSARTSRTVMQPCHRARSVPAIELVPWMAAFIGLIMIPFPRPDTHMEFLLLGRPALLFTSPRVKTTVAGWFRR